MNQKKLHNHHKPKLPPMGPKVYLTSNSKLILLVIGTITATALANIFAGIVISDVSYALKLPFKELGIVEFSTFAKTFPWTSFVLFLISSAVIVEFTLKILMFNNHKVSFSYKKILVKLALTIAIIISTGVVFTNFTSLDNRIGNSNLAYRLSTFKNFTDKHIVVGKILEIRKNSIIVLDRSDKTYEITTENNKSVDNREISSLTIGDTIAVRSDISIEKLKSVSLTNTVVGVIQEVKDNSVIVQDSNNNLYEIPTAINRDTMLTKNAEVAVGKTIVIHITESINAIKEDSKSNITGGLTQPNDPGVNLAIKKVDLAFKKVPNSKLKSTKIIKISAQKIVTVTTGTIAKNNRTFPLIVATTPIVVNPVIPVTKPLLVPKSIALAPMTTPINITPAPIASLRAPDADVLVVGSSLAGWATAISSAREGAKVILVSETSCIGGQATCAGVSTWDATWVPAAGGPWGLDKILQSMMNTKYKTRNVRIGGCYSGVANPGPDTYIAGDNFCPHPDRLEDGLRDFLKFFSNNITVKYADVYEIKTNGIIRTNIGELRGKIVVEATETGELIPSSLRRAVNPKCKQKTTYVAGIRRGGNGPKLSSYSYPINPGYLNLLNDWWSTGKYHWSGLTGQQGFPVYRRTHDLNGELVIYLNWMNDASTVSASYRNTKQMLAFLSTKGYGNWMYGFRKIAYNRTSNYRLNGQTHFGSTPRNVDSFASSVSVAGYRTDYRGNGCPTVSDGAEPYGIYDIPAGIGIPAKRVPILVAMPKSGDVSDLRASSLRMQPDEIGFGQAMGIVAEIAARKNILPQDVNINEVRTLLKLRGAKIDAN